jgi:hypothetical protein
MRIGEPLLPVELAPKVVLVIAPQKDEMEMGERLTVLTAEDAYRDGLSVDDGEGLIGAG